jgi:exo-1,4-beta-D-glucosaminidase
VHCEGNGSQPVLELPSLDASVPVHFLSLKLRDAAGRALSDNFYWISSKPDVLDYEKSQWWGTPFLSYADFTALNRLPASGVELVVRFTSGEAEVTLTNTSDRVAFFIELQLQQAGSGTPVLPIFWDDNYVSLLAKETRTLKVRFHSANTRGERLEVAVQGWNVKPQSVLSP